MHSLKLSPSLWSFTRFSKIMRASSQTEVNTWIIFRDYNVTWKTDVATNFLSIYKHGKFWYTVYIYIRYDIWYIHIIVHVYTYTDISYTCMYNRLQDLSMWFWWINYNVQKKQRRIVTYIFGFSNYLSLTGCSTCIG